MIKKAIPAIILLLILSVSHLRPQNSSIKVKDISNLGPPINTTGDDFSPTFTSDGKVIIYNSKRSNEQYQNLYISFYENGAWSAPEPLLDLNSQYNDETPYITPDGGYVFFASDRDGSFELPSDGTGRVRVSYDIYVSKYMSGRWSRPMKLPGDVNTAHHERSPALSIDLMTLYYTSWPYGNIIKACIMKADYVDGAYINPEPLPYPVNANSQDLGLVPAPDGKGYYFSSLRPGGYGGWDIYYIDYANGSFGIPVNLGPEINSSYNDLYLSVLEKQIYFCSNRKDGYGLYDIYAAEVWKGEPELKIVVRDKKTKKPLSVQLNLSSRIKKNKDETITRSITKKTDSSGEAKIPYDPGANDMDVMIGEKGYLPHFDTVILPEKGGNDHLIELVPIEKDASFDIRSIQFDYESSVIKPESFPYLNALSDYLKSMPSLRFEIIGHTDLHGGDEFNSKLSLERAQAVRDYLAARGLDGKRFTVKGMGKSQPKIDRIGPGFDEQNRRTEFRLIE